MQSNPEFCVFIVVLSAKLVKSSFSPRQWRCSGGRHPLGGSCGRIWKGLGENDPGGGWENSQRLLQVIRGLPLSALLGLNNNNCRKHWAHRLSFVNPSNQSEGTGSWDSCTEVQPPSCLLPGYSQSTFRIDESSTWISPPWWVTERQGLLKVPSVWLSQIVERGFFCPKTWKGHFVLKFNPTVQMEHNAVNNWEFVY